MTRRKLSNLLGRKSILLITGVTLAYSFIFVGLFPQLGTAVGTFEVIPVLIVAWFLGLKVGLLTALFTILWTDFILYPMVGLSPTQILEAGFLTGAIVTILIGIIIGRLHDLREQLKKELKEKARAETALVEIREGLETRIQERTQALQASESYYRTLFQNSVMPIVIYGPGGIILNANTLAAQNMNTTPETVIGKNILQILPFDTTQQFLERLDNIFTTGTGILREEAIQLPAEIRWFWTNAQPILDADGTVTAVHVVAQDITDLKQTETALTLSEHRWQFALEGSGDGVWDWRIDNDEIFFSRQWKAMLGYEESEIEHTHPAWEQLVHPDDLEQVQAELDKHYAGKTAVYSAEYRLRCKDGSYKWIHARGKVIDWDEHNNPKRVIGTHTDITERKQTEEMILNVARGVSAATGSYFFRSLVAYLGKTLQADMAFVGESQKGEVDRVHTVAVFADGMAAPNFIYDLADTPCENVVGKEVCVFEKEVYQKFPLDEQLKEKHIEGYIGAPLFSSDNRPLGLMAVLFRQPLNLEDVENKKHMLQIFAVRAAAELERVRAEEALRQSEAKLQQAQKLEAIGRLAGGIAHDFNNILTVIISYSDLILRDHSDEYNEVQQKVKIIKEAGQRAAHVTQQLLAFSRRQVLAPTILNLNTAVIRATDMLEHLIGEDVILQLNLQEGLWSCRADPSQIEQVILNLVINGRDAMPTGGNLTIETKNHHLKRHHLINDPDMQPGRYVSLRVIDTGTGMDKETQAKIFEPFFTTKEGDKGTGLGLATVHGIVTQSDGVIRVQSEPGAGTTFTLYFPMVDPEIVDIYETTAQAAPYEELGTETILLVEDEETVRNLVRDILQKHGFTVVVSESMNALETCVKHNGRIHLLLTDVVMPDMSGPELAKQLRQSYPELRILYMSGYTNEIVALHGVEIENSAFIQKPFTPGALAIKVRQVLDSLAV